MFPSFSLKTSSSPLSISSSLIWSEPEATYLNTVSRYSRPLLLFMRSLRNPKISGSRSARSSEKICFMRRKAAFNVTAPRISSSLYCVRSHSRYLKSGNSPSIVSGISKRSWNSRPTFHFDLPWYTTTGITGGSGLVWPNLMACSHIRTI